jgi:twitching motility protein PilT
MTIDQALDRLLTLGGSDLLVSFGTAPRVRRDGRLEALDGEALTPDAIERMLRGLLDDCQWKELAERRHVDFAFTWRDQVRIRGNAYFQRGSLAAAFRMLPLDIPTFDELGVPESIYKLVDRHQGLILVTGATGSGKSTTQAAMIDYINDRSAQHIMTVEDPVEFVHEDKKSLINQRELGTDTLSFANALKFVLRQDPDVILIGEMRDLETIALAITAAETGHLVFGTLHTTDAVQTVDRIIDVFPIYQQQQVRMQMSVNLVGVISQTLVKRPDGNGRVAAFETLVAIPSVRNLIREAKTHQIASMIQTGSRQGMMTLDQSLANLVKNKQVTFEDALAKASNVIEFKSLAGSA